ncbi:SRPBCC family protein [Paraflavitalea speifideaquila]|uniref:SRPBCC family protein n=1 Tax=Paraflavitalea speifideaquila TaxID=3076558 RepID=UPI0028E434D0|nr:SRPBCC domain-containing protein [Paraflavitalea speifideiaquila]
MIVTKQPGITKDLAKKQIIVVRELDAPIDQVWKAWTDSTLLDQWWAPRPWKANTRSMDFREGGAWHYNMEGPDGSIHWCRVDFQKIVTHKSFSSQDSFTDEKAIPIRHFLSCNGM